MRIARIDAYPVKLPFKEPFVIANAAFSDLYYVIVRLTTDCGIVGWGEAIPAWEVTGETQLGVIDAIHHFCEPRKTGVDLIGDEISSLEQVKALIGKLNPPDAPQVVWGAPSAKSAIEEAVLDAYGKRVSKPVYELFGGSKMSIPVAHVVGIHGVEETVGRVERAIASGAETIKLKVGTPDVGGLSGFDRDIEVIRQAGELVRRAKPSIRLVADANQGFVTPERTVEIARQIEGCLDWLEQPILAGDRAGFREIRKGCGIPLMADESVHDIHDAQLLMAWGAIDYLNLKLMKTGGLVEALRIAELAEDHGVPCQMGSMLENQIGCAICAHAFCCHRNIVTTELCSLGMLREWVGSGIEVGEHHLELSDGPGIGIEVDEEEIRGHLISEGDSVTYSRIRSGFGLQQP